MKNIIKINKFITVEYEQQEYNNSWTLRELPKVERWMPVSSVPPWTLPNVWDPKHDSNRPWKGNWWSNKASHYKECEMSFM